MLFETRYQSHFLLYEYYKHVFSQYFLYFLNHSFHIIWNKQPQRLLSIAQSHSKFSLFHLV